MAYKIHDWRGTELTRYDDREQAVAVALAVSQAGGGATTVWADDGWYLPIGQLPSGEWVAGKKWMEPSEE